MTHLNHRFFRTHPSKQSSVLLGLILIFTVIISITYTHSEAVSNKMDVDYALLSMAEPVQELYAMAEEKGVAVDQWELVWKGQLTSSEKDEWKQHLHHEGFQSGEWESVDDHHTTQHHLQKQIWVKQDHTGEHKVQFITDTQKREDRANFVYEWNGEKIDPLWIEHYKHIETTYFTELKHLPQSFACLQGVANAKLEETLFDTKQVENHLFDAWVEERLNGKVTHRVNETQFASIHGFIPEWDQHALLADDMKMNLQLSARHNALEEETRLTIGYPLILAEH